MTIQELRPVRASKFNPFNPAPKSPSPQATPAERAAAIAALRSGTEMVIERLQVMLDGVQLAVIQTQDVAALVKDIDLKNAQRVDISDLVCDVLLGLVLQGLGNIVKDSVKELTKETTQALLSTNTALRLLGTTNSSSGSAAKSVADAIASEAPKVTADVWANYSENVKNAVEAASDKIAEKVAEATKSALEPGGSGSGKTLGSKLSLSPTDQPRTAITRSTQSYVAAHRFAARTASFGVEAYLSSAPLTSSDLQSIVSALGVPSAPEDLETIRNEYSLLFEATIWAKLYGIRGGKEAWHMRPHPMDPNKTDPDLPGGRVVTGISSTLVAYWLGRFDGFGGVSGAGVMTQEMQLLQLFGQLGDQFDRMAEQMSPNQDVMTVGVPGK